MKMLATSVRIPHLHARTVRSRFSSSQSQGKDIKKAPAKERKTWNEEAMARALEAVLSGKFSVRRAAEQYNVPK